MKKTTRKPIGLLLAVLMICTVISAVPFGAAAADSENEINGKTISSEPQIVVSSVTANAGKTADVDISLQNNAGIVSATLTVTFDSSVLTLAEVRDAGVLGVSAHKPERVSPYKLAWANDTAEADFTVNGTIATLSFEVSENAEVGKAYPIQVSYDYDNYEIYNKELEPVFFTVENGTVTVVSSAENPTDTPEATTKAPEQPTEAPEATTKAPEQPTEAPEATTKAPEQPTEAPEPTTKAPEQPTEIPEPTTKAPEQPTEAPEATTKAPEQPTEAPEATTKAPEQPTEIPEATTKAPENPTEITEPTTSTSEDIKPTSPPKKTAFKKPNPVKVSVKKIKVSLKKLRRKAQIIKPLTIKSAEGTVTVTLVKKGRTGKFFKKLKVSKKGLITLKKGKYKKTAIKVKLKINIKGTSKYKPITLSRIVSIKLK